MIKLKWIKWHNPPGTRSKLDVREYHLINCETFEQVAIAKTGGAPHTTKGECTASGFVGTEMRYASVCVATFMQSIEREVDRRSIGLLGDDEVTFLPRDDSERAFMEYINHHRRGSSPPLAQIPGEAA